MPNVIGPRANSWACHAQNECRVNASSETFVYTPTMGGHLVPLQHSSVKIQAAKSESSYTSQLPRRIDAYPQLLYDKKSFMAVHDSVHLLFGAHTVCIHLIAYDSQALMVVFMFAFQAQDDNPEDWTSVQNFIGELKSKVKTREVVSGGIQVFD